MWIYIFLYILGLNYQASGEDPSTQMHYAVLKVEESAIDNITKILEHFKVTTGGFQVDEFEMTTNCEIAQDQRRHCKCTPGHFSWSLPQTCHPNTRVTMNGNFTLTGEKYYACLDDKNSKSFKDCHDDLLEEMKRVYSTFKGFDSLTIKEFRHGDVIALFEVNINKKFSSQELTNKTEELCKKLNAKYSLETKGLVDIHVPPGPVCQSPNRIICSSKVDLKSYPVWTLTRDGEVFDITNGTEANLTSTSSENSAILLTTISELWAGVFTCIYSQTSDLGSIYHKASAKLDIALLPEILILSDPEFPYCKEKAIVAVIVRCTIKKTYENYTVAWHGEGTKSDIKPTEVVTSDETIVHAVETTVGCNQEETPTITCSFKNRCNAQKNATIQINVISGASKHCKAEGEWKETKAGFSAVLICNLPQAGGRIRRCSEDGEWGDVESYCVNRELDTILQQTAVVDTGLGTVDHNSEAIFSHLSTATNDTEHINTYANVNASVYILVSMNTKLRQKANESILDNLLKSSSNLLNESLAKVWTKSDKESNVSLAERYLSSVERLIDVVDTTTLNTTLNTLNVQLETCNGIQASHCRSSVFDAAVSVEGSHTGSVKTTGFKHLVKYLPQKQDYEPNSIVVAVTTGNVRDIRDTQNPVVEITFQLLKQRPRSHIVECVSWDATNRMWSSAGCELIRVSPKEVHCRCSHLSSFATLMSLNPLHVAFETELTYTGLAVSIISLTLCLGMEFMAWSSLATTNALYLRHTAHVNIFLCLLVADCSFLASDFAKNISENWCQVFVVLKHFCYLSMFFWMLTLNITLLHQIILVFRNLSKKKGLVMSFLLGYMGPFLIVAITFITNDSGAKGAYYSYDTCWLSYFGLLEGSIFTFVIPIGIIIFVNMFTIVMVIMKLLEHPKDDAANHHQNDKKAAKSILRSVVILTPIFGVTWILGFAVMALDLTFGTMALVVNYAFILLNAFQGFFILLTTCLGDRMMRDALLKQITKTGPLSESTVTSAISTDSIKKK